MATKFKRAGSHNWSDANAWSTTSGGSADSSKPTASDDVIFDSNSGNITTDENANVRSLDCQSPSGTGVYAGTLTHGAFAINVGDATAGANNIAMRLSSSMTITVTGGVSSTVNFISTSATQQSIDFAGKNFSAGYIAFNASSGGDWKVSGSFDTSTFGRVTLTKGSLDASGKTLSWGQFISTNSNVRSLNITGSTVNLLYTSANTVWDITTPTNMTLTTDNTTRLILASSSSTRSFRSGGLTYGILDYIASGSTGGLDMTGGGSFYELNFYDASNARTLRFTAGTTTTIRKANGYNVRGTSGKLITDTSITGATHTISSAFDQSCNYLDLSYSIASGGGAFYAGANSTDSLNNTGWVFTAPPVASGFKIFGDEGMVS